MRPRLGSIALAAALGVTAMPSAFSYTEGLDCDDDLFPPKIYRLDLVNRDYDPDDPDAQLRPSYDQRIDDARANGPAIYDCYGEEMDFQSKRLHAAYSKLVSVLGEHDKQALRKGQCQWLREMDLLCGWGFTEGSRGRMVSDSCDVIHRGLRATELERRLTRLGTRDKVAGLIR